MCQDIDDVKETVAKEQGYDSFSDASQVAQNTMAAVAESRLDDDFSGRIAFRPTHWENEEDG